MSGKNSKRSPFPAKHVVIPKHGAHPPKRDEPIPSEQQSVPADPEDPGADEPIGADEARWTNEDERTLLEPWEDPDEPRSL